MLCLRLFNMDTVNLFDVHFTDEEQKYFSEVTAPQYLPSIDCPTISNLYDDSKYNELLNKIESYNLKEEINKFLKLAATSHIVFNYSKIADYYAHADKEIQQLFEQSCLVIIDINDAIAQGYVKLSDELKSAMIGQNNENNNIYTES